MLYVLALTDSSVPRWTFEEHRYHSVKLASGVYAVCEARTDVPAASDEELRRQHAAVVHLARQVDAVLPARFGSLVERGVLAAMVSDHREQILEALEDVRGRVQMTLRVLGRMAPAPVAPLETASGREYLAARRAATEPRIPAAAGTLLQQLAPFVVRERRERGAGQLLATVYHLVNAKDVSRYRKAAAGHEAARVTLSGPWPPFAFTPQVF